MMFVLIRAITYATIFIGLALIYVPGRLLSRSGIIKPVAIEVPQVTGIIIGVMGAVLALWCIFTFVIRGRGTPAPFDPPRRLVIQGPYCYTRNPMYLGAGFALVGAALFYGSLPLLVYTIFFFLATHLFVVLYEEPILYRTFGEEYETYTRRVRRWWPGIRNS